MSTNHVPPSEVDHAVRFLRCCLAGTVRAKRLEVIVAALEDERRLADRLALAMHEDEGYGAALDAYERARQ